MIKRASQTGLHVMRRRPGLAILLFVVQVTVGLIVAAPIGAAFESTFGGTGLGNQVMNPVLLADFFDQNAGLLGSVGALLFWSIPLLFVWSAAAGAGLTHALRDGGARSFWTGASSWFWTSLALSALHLVPAVIWSVVCLLAGILLGAVMSSQVWIFWVCFVAIPAVWIAGLAALDMVLDYARIGMVTRDQGAWESFWYGLRFSLRRGRVQLLYVVWYVPAALLLLLPTVVEIALGAGVLVFLLQQALLLPRQFVALGWIGAQVAFHEELTEQAWPALAAAVPLPAESPLPGEA